MYSMGSMSVVDKLGGSQIVDAAFDSSIPPWKRELIIKKRNNNNHYHNNNLNNHNNNHRGSSNSGSGSEHRGVALYGGSNHHHHHHNHHHHHHHHPAVHPKETSPDLHASGTKHKDSGQSKVAAGISSCSSGSGYGAAVESSVSSQKQRCRGLLDLDGGGGNVGRGGGGRRRAGSEGRMGEDRSESSEGPPSSPTCSSYSDGGFAYDGGAVEFEYGPGIVDRLRSKFISLTVAKERNNEVAVTGQPIRRVASLEHLLDADELSSVMEGKKYATVGSKTGLSMKARKLDIIKKARSMETLTAIDGQRRTASEDRTKANLVLCNENVVIVEHPKRSQSTEFGKVSTSTTLTARTRDLVKCAAGNAGNIEEDELPRPDTVRTYKKMFESSVSKETSGGKARGSKVGIAHKIAAQKNNIAKLDTSTNHKKQQLSSAKSWLEEAAASGLLKKRAANEKPPAGKDLKPRVDNGHDETGVKQVSPESLQRIREQSNVLVFGSKPRPSDNNEHAASENNVPTTNRPRIIDIKAKMDEKPVGMIKPLTVLEPSEQKENLINQAKTAMAAKNELVNGAVIENNVPAVDIGVVKAQSLKKGSAATSAVDSNSMVFNFTHKSNVVPSISNTQSSFSIQRPIVKVDNNTGRLVSNLFRGSDVSGIVLIPGMTTTISSDYSDDDDFVDGPCDDAHLPCDVVFEGENVIIGRSCILQKRNKQLKTAFDDNATSVYEYPSELLLAEEFATNNEQAVPEKIVANDDIVVVVDDNAKEIVDEEEPVDNEMIINSSLVNNTALTSTGLANYIPSKSGATEDFELGVSRPPMEPSPVTKSAEPNPATGDDMVLKPADDAQASSWSTSQVEETDLLF